MSTITSKWTAAIIAVILSSNSTAAFAGLDSKKAKYVGGTMPLRDEVEGALSASDRSHLYFYVEKGADYKLTTLGIGALPVLFSKKRRHYLTIQFKDAESKEGGAAIFELGKDVIRTMLATLAARTGKTIEYEDDEARKSGNK